MAFVEPRKGIYYTPGRGQVNVRKHTYAGSGAAPAGLKKVPVPSISSIPVTTVSPSGHRTVSTIQPVRSVVPHLSDLLTPGPTAKETAEAAHTLGVKAQATDPFSKLLDAFKTTANTAVHDIAQGAHDASQAVHEVASLPNKHVHQVLGRKTLGTPTVAQLLSAANKGKLRVNRRGKLTVPVTRQAAQQLVMAKQQIAAGSQLSGPLTPGQKRFAEIVARGTGLSPHVVAAQALAEESGQAAAQREAEGNHDWLNIGYSDSGPLGLTASSVWSTPESAAHATVQFLKGQRFDPSQGIRDILPAAAGKPDAVQIAAIGNSGWATSDYGKQIAATYPEVSGGQPAPKELARLHKAEEEASALGIPTKGEKILGPPPKLLVSRFKAGAQAAHELAVAHIPYVWGGGHASFTAAGGLDCSGAVSFVLHRMGVLDHPLTSGDMGQVLEPGPGAVTVFYNAEHTFMRIGNRYFGTSVDNSSKGLAFYGAPPPQYLAQFNVGHVPGLGKKTAVQMGIHVSPTSGFPGVEMSADGTTAVVEPGVGVRQGKPAFSAAPIVSSTLPPLSPLLAASAPLPAAFSQSGPGQAALEEAPPEEANAGTIAQVLHGRRL